MGKNIFIRPLSPRSNKTRVKVDLYRPKYSSEIEEVPARNYRRPNKYMTSRACCVTRDALGQLSSNASKLNKPKDQHRKSHEQSNFESNLPDTVNKLDDLKKLLSGNAPKVENASQYVVPESVNSSSLEISGSQMVHNVDTIDDVEAFVLGSELMGDHRTVKEETTSPIAVQRECKQRPIRVRICDVPRIKFIAEKFSRFKKNAIEVRRLTEKIVCIEYDVFDDDSAKEPVQILRAFFSIKPSNCANTGKCNGEDATVQQIPSVIRQKYQISEDDLKKFNEKEIEIIDETIAENKPYLDDLKTILKRKHDGRNRHTKTTLDLQYLYEMAKRESPPSDYDFSKLLSEAELKEVKDLILKRCVSSFHRISRRVVRNKEDTSKAKNTGDLISKSTILDLMRDC